MHYEIQIFSKDRTKFIRLEEHRLDNGQAVPLAWEDFYYAMGAVIDDKADRIQEENKLIARLEVRDFSFDQVVDIMCEDLPPALTRILTEEEEISYV